MKGKRRYQPRNTGFSDANITRYLASGGRRSIVGLTSPDTHRPGPETSVDIRSLISHRYPTGTVVYVEIGPRGLGVLRENACQVSTVAAAMGHVI